MAQHTTIGYPMKTPLTIRQAIRLLKRAQSQWGEDTILGVKILGLTSIPIPLVDIQIHDIYQRVTLIASASSSLEAREDTAI